MKQKKNKVLIIIVIILVLILIALGVFAYCYLETDFLKGNKELFLKYATQTLEKENGLIENDLINYLEKQKNTAYTNKSNINISVNSNSADSNLITAINNMTAEISGKNDRSNSKTIQDINIKYSENASFPLSFKSTQDKMGIQTQYVGSKYIVLNKEGLDSVASSSSTYLEKLAKTMSQFDNLFTADLNLTDIMQNIKDNYIPVLNQNIHDESFEKVNENGQTGYKLTLNSEKFKNVTTKLAETLKKDQTTLDKINEFIKIQNNSSELTTSDIDTFINNLNNNVYDESYLQQDIEITIYNQKGKVNKISIKSNNIQINIEKLKEGNDLKYNISIELNENEKNNKVNIFVKYDGLTSLQNIQEDYEIEATENTNSYKYNISNNVNFEESSNITEFTDTDSYNVTALEEEPRTAFLNNLEQRIIAVNKMQMEKVGLDETANLNEYINPVNIVSETLSSSSNNGSLLNENQTEQNEVLEFNKKFELYEQTNQGGGTVKGLLTVISENNGLDDDEDDENKNNNRYLIKEINYNGEEMEVNKQTIAVLKGEISTEDAFRVEFEKDENSGRIYRVVISKK